MWTLLVKCPVCGGVLNSGVGKYTNVRFGTDENVLFVEVSSIQGLVSTQMCDLGQMKMSCLWRCPQFRGW